MERHMSQTITTTPMQTALLVRYNYLMQKVQDEQANLSDWRKGEAFDLALTNEEKSDLYFLIDILAFLGGTCLADTIKAEGGAK
jgi:hypothetical protein